VLNEFIDFDLESYPFFSIGSFKQHFHQIQKYNLKTKKTIYTSVKITVIVVVIEVKTLSSLCY